MQLSSLARGAELSVAWRRTVARSVRRTHDTSQSDTAGRSTPRRCLPLYAAAALRSPSRSELFRRPSEVSSGCSCRLPSSETTPSTVSLTLHSAPTASNSVLCPLALLPAARSIREFSFLSSNAEVLFSISRDGRACILRPTIGPSRAQPGPSMTRSLQARSHRTMVENSRIRELERAQSKSSVVCIPEPIADADSLLLSLSAAAVVAYSFLSSSPRPSNHRLPPPSSLDPTQ
jgi:hypothetical protein